MNNIEFQNLDDILHNIVLSIPDYQRNYSWTNSEVSTLLEDIKGLYLHNGADGTLDHFCGAIVLVPFDKEVSRNTRDILERKTLRNYNKVSVIDGQQRLSTLSLLLMSIKNYAKDNSLDAREVDSLILTTRRDEHGECIPIINFSGIEAQDCYRSILSGAVPKAKANSAVCVKRIIDAYNLCHAEVRSLVENAVNPQEAVDCLLEQIQYHLTFVGIFNKDVLDAYQVFESLNSTGLSLTPAEQLKNLLLMKSDKKDRTLSLWEELVETVGEKDLVDFLVQFLFAEEQQRISKEKVYPTFKKMLKASSASEVLKKLTDSSLLYRELRRPSAHIPAANTLLDFADFGVKQPYAPMLAAARRFDIETDDFRKIADSILVFTVRHIVCGQSPNRLDPVFGDACRIVVDESKTAEDVVAFFKTHRIDDGLFEEHFAGLKFEHTAKPQRQAKALLRRIEERSHGRDRPLNISRNNLTVEHIIPKQPTMDDISSWLGPEVVNDPQFSLENFIDQNVKSVGNLALLFGKENTSASNNTYSKKLQTYTTEMKTGEGQGRGVPAEYFVLIQELVENYPTVFDSDSIQERAKDLAVKAVTAWS